MIGDFRASGINSILTTQDTSIPDNLDSFLAGVMQFKKLAPGCVLKAFTVDFAHAYKHVPMEVSQREFATIVFADTRGTPHYATLKTQPFGSRRAPANWGRVTAFTKWVMSRLFACTVRVFVDGCFVTEPDATIWSAYEALNTVCDLLGLTLEPSKTTPPTDRLLLLGADIHIKISEITATLPDRKRTDIVTELRKILERNNLTPAEAAKMRGRLGYAQSLLFGRAGRAMLAPFAERQYSARPGRSHPLSVDLRETIPWWIAVIGRLIPRRIPFLPIPHMVVYTDASGSGHLGAVAIYMGVTHTFSTHLPDWFTEGNKIYEFEMAGTLFGLLCALEIAYGAPIILFCDNMGAKGTVIRGSSRTRTGRALAGAFWGYAAAAEAAVWVEHVSSPLNIGDPPSRKCSHLKSMCDIVFMDVGIPKSFYFLFNSSSVLFRAQENLTVPERGFVPAIDCRNCKKEFQI